MKYMAQYSSGEDWVQPDSVVQQQIRSGSIPLSLPGPRTPANMVATELFVKRKYSNSTIFKLRCYNRRAQQG